MLTCNMPALGFHLGLNPLAPIVKTCVTLRRTPVWNLLDEQDGTQDRVCDVRCELNLSAGSLVTVAYGLLETVSESSQSSSWRQTETVHPAQRVQSENGKRT